MNEHTILDHNVLLNTLLLIIIFDLIEHNLRIQWSQNDHAQAITLRLSC